MLDRFFGKKPVPQSEAVAAVPTAATPTLAETVQLIEKREAYLGALIAKEVSKARECGTAGRQAEALECIKRKRMYEKERSQLAAKKLSVIQTDHSRNALRFNNVIMKAESQAVSDMQREMRMMGNIEGIEAHKERQEDALTDATEILDAASRPIGQASEHDDDDLLNELEQLELAQTLTEVRMPAREQKAAPVPTHDPARAREEREDREAREELEALASSMKMEQPMPMPLAAC